jgi:RimJ/RimL family protein N-acetyltransferase
VATRATRGVADHAFRKLGLNRLQFLIPVDNVASQRVAQKTGAKFEGILRNRLMISGRIHDAAVYSLVPTDMQAALL